MHGDFVGTTSCQIWDASHVIENICSINFCIILAAVPVSRPINLACRTISSVCYRLEAELDATKKELIKSKTEILQTQLNFFVKESKLKEDIDRMNQ